MKEKTIKRDITGTDVLYMFGITKDVHATIDYILDRTDKWTHEDLLTWYDSL